MKSNELSLLRADIDRIDEALVPMLDERIRTVRRIARVKQAEGLPIFDPTREASLCERTKNASAAVRESYQALVETSKREQERLAATCGLIGSRLSHSLSPVLHEMLGRGDYALFSLSEAELSDFLHRSQAEFLNVTVPYKRTVMPLVDRLTPVAKAVGAVNLILRGADGTLTGDNTDAAGFAYLLARAGICAAGKKAVVLGTGGGAAAVRYALEQAGAREIVLISRNGCENYGTLQNHRDAELLVNATPVGMFPDVWESPVTTDGFDRLTGVVDLIYNPVRTRLLQDAASRGIPCADGMEMLVGQAAETYARAYGKKPDTEGIAQAMRMRLQNTVLVGMPGVGKTTVGRYLAAMTGKPFLDTDELYTARFGKTPADVIRNEGEQAFRRGEREILRSLSSVTGAVIATGGGSVLDAENRGILRANGYVVRLTRDVCDVGQDRPLGADAALASAREPIYLDVADVTVAAGNTVRETAIAIWKEWSAQ